MVSDTKSADGLHRLHGILHRTTDLGMHKKPQPQHFRLVNRRGLLSRALPHHVRCINVLPNARMLSESDTFTVMLAGSEQRPA